MKNEVLRELFNKHDPMQLVTEEDQNWDEYDSEIELLNKRIDGCKTAEQVEDLLQTIFRKMFGTLGQSAEVNSSLKGLASEIWHEKGRE